MNEKESVKRKVTENKDRFINMQHKMCAGRWEVLQSLCTTTTYELKYSLECQMTNKVFIYIN